MLAAGTISYTYDANGNLTSAGGDSYNWDYDNRLTGSNVGGIATSYGYDALGVRTSSVISGLNTSYLWDRLAENPLLIGDGSHAYVYADGPLAQIDTSNNRQYLLTDALNSVRGLSDNSGTLVGSVNYSVFGSIRSQSGATSILGFTGEVYNPQTQLLYLRARDYAVTLGRLLSVDTVSPNAHEAQGYNLYAYVANNPTSWVDPTGHIISSSDSYRNQTAATGAMMKEVWGYDLNKYGSFMLRTGRMLVAAMPAAAALGGAVPETSPAFFAIVMLTFLILSCLALTGTPCFDGKGLLMLGSDVAAGAWAGTQGMADSELCQGYLQYQKSTGAAMGKDNPCGLEPDEDDSQKEMRVQLQRSRNGVTRNTDGIPVVSRLKIGVTTSQVRTALSQLYNNAQTSDWFPKSQNSNHVSSIIKVSQELSRFPPGGIDREGYNIPFNEKNTWLDKNLTYRVDVENLRGWNLRQ